MVLAGDGNDWESIIPDRLMLERLTAAASAAARISDRIDRTPRSLRLVVDGYEFNAYVDSRADGRVATAADLSDERGRAWR